MNKWYVVGAALAVAMIGSVRAAEPPPVLQLDAELVSGADNQATVFGGLLCRELERQALLIAARDELGLRTRDMAAGEPFATAGPEPFNGVTVSMLTHNIRSKRSLVELSLGEKKAAKPAAGAATAPAPTSLGQAEFPLPEKGLVDYAGFVTQAERQSRTDFVELLKKSNILAGHSAAPVAWAAGQADPVALASLNTMNVYAQFTAARMLHEQMRTSGASPERLAALSHAYANLGFLTQFLWNADGKVFAARALLYAERLVVHENNSPASLQARGYARAMAGLHRLALEDITAARKAGAADPSWLPAIHAFCHYDLEGELKLAAAKSDDAPLAWILAADIADDSYDADRILKLTNDGLAALPDNRFLEECAWHSDELQHAGEMSDALVLSLPAELRLGMDPLHLDLAKPMDDASGDGDLGPPAAQAAAAIARLTKAGAADTGEPSLAMLASLARSEAFSAAAAVISCNRQRDPLSEEEFQALAKQIAPLWKGDPNAAWATGMLVDQDDANAIRTAMKRWHPRDTGRWTYDNIFFLNDDVWRKLASQDGVRWFSDALVSLDCTPLDYSHRVIRSMEDGQDLQRIEGARHESPFCPGLYAGWMIHYPVAARRDHLDVVEKTLADIEKNFSDKPRLLHLAGEWACDVNQFARGIKLLSASQLASPTPWAARSLIDACVHVGDIEAAKQAADVELGVPEDAGDAPSLADDVAGYLAAAGQPQEAVFYTRIAMRDGDDFGYQIAAAVETRLGNLDAAAELLREDTSANSEDAPLWYLWALRTGHASLNDAKAAADAYAAANPDGVMNGWTALAAGDPRAALKAFARDEKNYDVRDWARYTTLAVLAKDKRATDNGLKHLADSKSEFAHHLAAAARNESLHYQMEVLDVLCAADWRNAESTSDRALAGSLLAALGHKAEAMPLLTRTMHMGHTITLEYALAWDALKRMGEDPAAISAKPLAAVDPKLFAGTYAVTTGGDTEQWTLSADGSVTASSTRMLGSWLVDDHRLLILFTPKRWAVFPLAPAAGGGAVNQPPAELAGDSSELNQPARMQRVK